MKIGIGLGLFARRRHAAGPVLNVPTLVVQESGSDTHAENEGADLTALVTVDDGDGATTSNVQLFLDGALVGSMTDGGGGSWSRAVNDALPGTHVYTARRVTNLGNKTSAAWSVVVTPQAPSLDEPDDEDSINVGDSLTFEATGSAAGFDTNTSKVEFYVNAILRATANSDTAGVWGASWNTTGATPAANQSVIAKRYWVGVSGQTGTVDSTASIDIDLTAGDVTAPTLTSAIINSAGTSLTLTYNEALDTGSTPANGAYSLAGTVRTVTGVNVTGSTVVLTLSGAVAQGASVTVSYTAGGSPVQDAAGNDAGNLTNQAVTNNSTSDQTAPTLSSAIITAGGTALELTYSEALDTGSVPALGAFTLAGTLLAALTGTPAVSGSKVTLTLSPAAEIGETGITISYTAGGSPIQDVAGNDAANLSSQAVTNNSAHAFVPSDVSGLLLNLDMQDTGNRTLNGGSTALVSINNSVSTQLYDTPANDVPYEATGLNGHPCLHPSGVVGDRLTATEAAVAAPFQNVPTATAFAYISNDAADPASLSYWLSVCASASNNGSHSFGQSSTSTGRNVYRTVTDGGSSSATESGTAVPLTSGHTECWKLNNGTISHSVNNGAGDPSAGSNSPATLTPNRIAFFCKADSTPDSPWAGRWGQTLIWGRILTTAETTRIHNYLTARWS